MPFQQSNTQSFTPPIDERSMVYYQGNSLESTQPTSNLTPSFISTSSNTRSSNLIQTYPTTTETTEVTNAYFNTQFGCRSILAANRVNCQSNSDYFKLLYCMYTGCEGTTVRSRIQRLIENKHSTLTIRAIKPLKKQYVEELLRRYSYLMLKEKGVSVSGKNSINFRPANKSQEEINGFFHSPHFILPTSEKLHIEFEMESFITQHENQLKVTLDLLQQQGSEIQRSDLKKMRLWEAIFLDTKYMRNKLVTLKDTMSRQQIDARTSNVGPLSLFQLAAEKYNDPDWVVYSRTIPDLNEKFRSPIRLTLMTDEEKMTESSVKHAYTDAKGKMNVALANWKRSGNGKGNKNYKVTGLGYDDVTNQNHEVMFVDDDRFNFVNQLHIAYFWSLCEISGLTHHISQNCSALNDPLNGNTCSKKSPTSGMVHGRTTNEGSMSKKQKFDQHTEALFAMVSDIKKGFVNQTIQLKQSSLNSQLLEAEEGLINL